MGSASARASGFNQRRFKCPDLQSVNSIRAHCNVLFVVAFPTFRSSFCPLSRSVLRLLSAVVAVIDRSLFILPPTTILLCLPNRLPFFTVFMVWTPKLTLTKENRQDSLKLSFGPTLFQVLLMKKSVGRWIFRKKTIKKEHCTVGREECGQAYNAFSSQSFFFLLLYAF